MGVVFSVEQGEMSEIPESLRGTYVTPSTIVSDAFEPFVLKGTIMPLQAHIRIGATTFTAAFTMEGIGRRDTMTESDPGAKIQNIVLSNVLGEERAVFNTSDEDGKPDLDKKFILDKDGLHLGDDMIDGLEKALSDAFVKEIKAIPEKQKAAMFAKFKQLAKDQFGVLRRYEGTETSLPLMVGGGAALILLLMVK